MGSADTRGIDDLVSIRVILPTLDDCYLANGLLHINLGEIVDYSRFDEFVGANARVNGYSALQTTLETNQGSLEVALVTPQMEEFNRWGVVSLLRRGERDLEHFTLKSAFGSDGKVLFLPKLATGVDLVCAMGSRLLANANAIKIDNREFPLTVVVPNAARFEVILGNEARIAPLPELLDYCLPATKRIILGQLEVAERYELASKGKKILEGVLSPRGILDLGDVEGVVRDLIYSHGSLEGLYLKVGSGVVSREEVAHWLDAHGITKDRLKLTTVRVAGLDQPGILDDLIHLIRRQGDGVNIKGIDLQGGDDNRFILRLVVEQLESSSEEAIRVEIGKDSRFDEWVVV